MSDIDDVLAFFDPGPRARECGDGERADTYDRARLELAALREAKRVLERIFSQECALLEVGSKPRLSSAEIRDARAALAAKEEA